MIGSFGLLCSLAAAARARGIDWSEEQRRQCLALAANNARFFLLPGKTAVCPPVGQRGPQTYSVAMALIPASPAPDS